MRQRMKKKRMFCTGMHVAYRMSIHSLKREKICKVFAEQKKYPAEYLRRT